MSRVCSPFLMIYPESKYRNVSTNELLDGVQNNFEKAMRNCFFKYFFKKVYHYIPLSNLFYLMRQIILRLQSEIIDCSDDIFSIQTQEISSVSTNTLDENYESWAGPIRYQPEHNCKFVLSDILDNTEGIAAFADLRCPVNAKLWVDVGGGASDAPSKWLENKYPGLIVMVIDPFARSHEHNISIQIH